MKNNRKIFKMILWGITIVLLLYSFFMFGSSYVRLKTSFVDLWNSARYYFKSFFCQELTAPSVIEKGNVKFFPLFNLPATFEEFKLYFQAYTKKLVTKENLINYIQFLSQKMCRLLKIFLLIGVPILLISIIAVRLQLQDKNNDYNKESKPLKLFKRIEKQVYLPIYFWCNDFKEYFKKHNIYAKIWLCLALFNFNIVTIFVEFLAFYFYFIISFDFSTIYLQFYKLICDLSIISKLPTIILLVFILVVFNLWRKKYAINKLEKMEQKDCHFIDSRPVCLMLVGTMGKKKTTILTDMALSLENIFKEKTLDKMLEMSLKFPSFPYINLENYIKEEIEKHNIYNLVTVKKTVQRIENFYFKEEFLDRQNKKAVYRNLRKNGYKYKNLCFDYSENERHYFDDNLKLINIWQVIEEYAKLYFVYYMKTSLLLSNYSIRQDSYFEDTGNFPLFDLDFFTRDSKKLENSKYAHILDFDSLRLGKKIDETNAKKDSFDFGIVSITEIGKERKNALELRETKGKADETNQKNDGFNNWLKMARHSSTIDFYPFVKVLSDDQRAESLGSDARDLFDIVSIANVQDKKITLPFFALFEIIEEIAVKKFNDFYLEFRHNRGDKTLLFYLLQKLTSKIYKHYLRVYNLYGYNKVKLQVESGTMTGEVLENDYYLMNKKIYSDRFSTDCFNGFFDAKNRKSKVGICDLKAYKTTQATFDEMLEQHSYFINDLNNLKDK